MENRKYHCPSCGNKDIETEADKSGEYGYCEKCPLYWYIGHSKESLRRERIEYAVAISILGFGIGAAIWAVWICISLLRGF